MNECAGCKTCEIACSFKHYNEFSHNFSSIEIVELVETSGYKVRLIDESSGIRIPCDGCLDMSEPMCVQFCPHNEVLNQIINQFRLQLIENHKLVD